VRQWFGLLVAAAVIEVAAEEVEREEDLETEGAAVEDLVHGEDAADLVAIVASMRGLQTQ
jgi:hypothetical protein